MRKIMRFARPLTLLFLGAVAAGACVVRTEATDERLCTPGNYVFCRCQDRSEGTKLCKPDGKSFDACTHCLSGVDDAVDPDSGSTSNNSSDSGSSGGDQDTGTLPDADITGVDGGSCSGKPNGTPCAAGSSSCRMLVCNAGQCTGDVVRPDGFNWTPGDDTARCCAGQPVHTTTLDNCGVCGGKCQGAQMCLQEGAGWFCRGCQQSTECWSGCCSLAFGLGSCAASDCSTGACKQSVCPSNSTCTLGAGNSSNFCKYE